MFESVRIGQAEKAEFVIVAKFADAELAPAYRKHALAGAIKAAAGRPESTGEPGRIGEAFDERSGVRVVCVGLGKKKKFQPGDLRTIAAGAGRRAAAVKARSVRMEFGPALEQAGADEADAGRAAGEAFGLLSWNNLAFKGKASDGAAAKRQPLTIGGGGKAFGKGLALGLALAESANLTRTLSETPPNIATPMWMAEQARRLANDTGMKCRVFAGQDLERERFTGLINVGKASENKPCMIRLEYTPPKKSKQPPAVLIGKTMTYDTGGLSLKVNNGMVGMKRDKDGGCAVLGAMHAIATTIRPNRRVVALLAAAENSISDEAYRPDDVITYRNGVTVEVTNTDAEGRLVLCDLLADADADQPAVLMDFATLTGAARVALGPDLPAMFASHDGLAQALLRAGEAAHDPCWRLPLWAGYAGWIDSKVADMNNVSARPMAGSIVAALYLQRFVSPTTEWAHFDVYAWNDADRPGRPEGGEAQAMRGCFEMLRTRFAD
ncbi:MAG: leucyl aminopeptidase family protein [Phycisphaeraceae bacterium]|nr:leucyl aminopeptidase family protein [Phycisphaeraceae bacterium]